MARDVHQILVHAGARADRSDDERYVQQACVYLETKNETRWSRVICDDPEVTSEVHRRNRPPEHSRSGGSQVDWGRLQRRLSFVEDTQLAYSELRSQLAISSTPANFCGVRQSSHKTASSGTGEDPKSPHSVAKRQHSLDPGLSQSSYLVTPILDRSKRLRLNDVVGSTALGSPSTGRGLLDWETRLNQLPEPLSEKDSGTVATNESPSELPTSYSLSDVASESSKERPSLPDGAISGSGLRDTATTIIQKEEQAVQNEAGESQPGEGTEPPMRRCSPSIFKSTTVQPHDFALGQSDLAVLRSLRLEIRPAPAKLDMAKFTTHVTKALSFLANESSTANCFNPVSVSREIQIWERGHWRLDCSHWPVKRRVAFWQMLEKAIGGGTAGPDVWCTRGPDVHYTTSPGIDSHDFADPASSNPFGLVRVYCWGEVVRHIYILLYVSSSSKVRNLWLQWLDSERKVVVQMPGA